MFRLIRCGEDRRSRRNNILVSKRGGSLKLLISSTRRWESQVGVLAELLRDPLPSRMRKQVSAEGTCLPLIVDRTLPCTVDSITMGCVKVRAIAGRMWESRDYDARILCDELLLVRDMILFGFSAKETICGLRALMLRA